MNLTSGTNLNGTWTGIATIPAYSEAGTWMASYVVVGDDVGNYKYYYTADLQTLGFPTQLLVTSNPNTTPPTLTNPTFNPTPVTITATSTTRNATTPPTAVIST